MEVLSQYTWVVGALLLLALLAQMILAAVGMSRRLGYQQTQLVLARQLIDERIRAAQSDRQREEQRSLAWSGWRKFQVGWKRHENARKDICSFYLMPHDGKSIPRFEPGQFLTFKFHVPGQAKPVVRCYSLSDSPKGDYYRISVRRVPPPAGSDHPPGLSSGFLHDHIDEGAIVDVKAPSGNFHLDPTRADPVVLIAGGVGITPLLSMLNAIVESGARRETWLFLGVRDRDDHPMKDHLESIAREHSNVHLQVVYSHPRMGIDRPGLDYHQAGFMSVALFRALLPSNNYDWYCCGPPPMMDLLLPALAAWGIPEERMHHEKFGPGAKRHEAPPALPASGDAPGIEVAFARSGRKLKWTQGSGTLLQLARANGISIESGCEQGNCGTCQTAMRSGEVEYLDQPAYEFERGTCLVCVCRPKGPVELDA